MNTLQRTMHCTRMLLLAVILGTTVTTMAQAQGAKMSIKVHTNEGDFEMTTYSQDNKMRVDAGTAQEKTTFILREDTKKILFLIPQEKQYMEMPLTDFSIPKDSDVLSDEEFKEGMLPFLKPTGKKKDIKGVSCEQWLITDPDMSGEMWLARRPNVFNRLRKNPMVGGFLAIGMLSETSMFPMMINLKGKDGSLYNLEVTEISSANQPATLFEAPTGYSKMDMSGMMGE